MPELPEVETLRRSLAPTLLNRRIEGVRVFQRLLRYPVQEAKLRRRLRGRRVHRLLRRSKYLLASLEGDQHLLIHLGMSGRLELTSRQEPLEPHVHVCFDLDDGRQLRFRDPRRFGQIDVLNSRELVRDRRLTSLGMEPLSPECSGAYFYRRSRGVRKPVKNFLMDARHVVGLGNIYANEALFVAAVHPQRAAGRMSRRSWDRLAGAVKQVLEEAIRQGGTTLNDFQDANGEAGYFQVFLRVYQRHGERCSRCTKTLRRKVLSGRSTFYCPGCQR